MQPTSGMAGTPISTMAKLEVPHVEDELTNRVVRLLLDRINTLGDVALLSGQLVTHTFEGTSAEKVNHKLGRKPIGYIVVGTSAAATIHGRSHTTSYLELTASAICTADLWVF